MSDPYHSPYLGPIRSVFGCGSKFCFPEPQEPPGPAVWAAAAGIRMLPHHLVRILFQYSVSPGISGKLRAGYTEWRPIRG